MSDLSNLLRYYERSRGVGHTKAVVDSAKMDDNRLILTSTVVHANSLSQLVGRPGAARAIHEHWEGNYEHPLLIDNYLMVNILQRLELTELNLKKVLGGDEDEG